MIHRGNAVQISRRISQLIAGIVSLPLSWFMSWSLMAMLPVIAMLPACTPDKPASVPVQAAWEQPSRPANSTGTASTVAASPAAPATPAASATNTPSNTMPTGSTAGTTNTTSTTESGADMPIAFVNGQAIGRRQLAQMLMDSHGATILEQLVALTAIKQRAAAEGIAV
ncbi:MAG: hypothetical protein FWC56_03635, partial [Phycisphaerae bacterium]|nr:hypothetical protein [Phycisphaerae bacterium]